MQYIVVHCPNFDDDLSVSSIFPTEVQAVEFVNNQEGKAVIIKADSGMSVDYHT